ncbi:MAG: helix-turn-helix transcriptional regulator [Ruminococcaceae bacterium]|nr:helix-turn-helix transcriptional regulator [Oscillospiraceae bacterium]
MFHSYYRDVFDLNNNFANENVSLQVNCAGHEVHEQPVAADTVRRDQYLYYQTHGTVRVTSPLPCRLQAGDLIWYKGDVPFTYRDEGVTEHYFVHFTGTAAVEWLQKAGLTPHTVYRMQDGGAVEDGFRELFRAFLRRDTQFETATCAKLLTLLATVGRCVNGENGKRRGARLEKSLQYIHDHLAERLSVAALAACEHLSVSRYRALFCDMMKQPPLEYVLALRMDLACRLLATSDMSVQEIALAVGYEDSHYFSRLFHKKTGITPLVYRARKKELCVNKSGKNGR